MTEPATPDQTAPTTDPDLEQANGGYAEAGDEGTQDPDASAMALAEPVDADADSGPVAVEQPLPAGGGASDDE